MGEEVSPLGCSSINSSAMWIYQIMMINYIKRNSKLSADFGGVAMSPLDKLYGILGMQERTPSLLRDAKALDHVMALLFFW